MKAISNAILRAALLSSVTGVFPAAAAQARAQSHSYNIPEQSVADALTEFGHQSGRRVLFPYDAVSGRRSPALSGVLSDTAVLKRLADAGGLIVRSDDGRTVTLARMVQRNQDAAAGVGQATPAAGEQGRAGDQQGVSTADVVVTGSRVVTNGNSSPTPLTVVPVNQILATRPTTVFEGLRQLPQFSGSTGVTNNPQAAGADNANVSALSLRGLGANRTLTLYDGHRLPPTQFDGSVDANLIPQMLLKRVDIVTGGVSAVYGSGGVIGAVNFVTDRSFNGLKVQGQYGISQKGDDPSYEVGIAGGMDLFGGRGHIEGSYQQHYDAGILSRSTRSIATDRYTLQGNGTAATPYFLVAGATLADSPFGGRIATFSGGSLAGQQFAVGGVLVPFRSGTNAGVTQNGVEIGGDGGYYNSSSLKTKLRFHQAQQRFDFDVTDTLHFYLTGTEVFEDTYAIGSNNKLQFTNLGACNGFLLPAYRTALGCTAANNSAANANQPNFTFNKFWDPAAVPPTVADDHTEQWWINTGLEGKLGKFDWSAAFTATQVRAKNYQSNDINNGRLFAALDAVVNPANGQVVCGVTLTNPGLYPGCVPLNVFGPGSESREAVNYILTSTSFRTRTKFYDGTAQISGDLFDGWAGPIRTALSGGVRRQTYEQYGSTLPASTDPLDCTGLRFNNCRTGQTAKTTTSLSSRPPVTETVGEVAVEALVPLLTDVSFARDLSLNLAYRYAHYTDHGSLTAADPYTDHNFDAHTWKIGGVWKITDGLTIRATRSRDFRAPTLFDLYRPADTQFIPFNDLFISSANPGYRSPPTLSQTSGNPNLRPEYGDTATLGVVFQLSPHFSVAIDAYDIRIKNAIIQLFGTDPRVQAACNASLGSSPLCTLIERPLPYTNTTPANAVTKWYIGFPVNISEQRTRGIDGEANFTTDLAGQAFSLRGLVSYQPYFRQAIPGLTPENNAGMAFGSQNAGGPIWRGSVFVHYNLTDALAVDWNTRYRSGLRFTANSSEVAISRVPSYSTSNFTFSAQVTPKSSIYFNVLNIFNKQPDPAASPGQANFPGFGGGYYPEDDVVGRYFNVGARLGF